MERRSIFPVGLADGRNHMPALLRMQRVRSYFSESAKKAIVSAYLVPATRWAKDIPGPIVPVQGGDD